MKKIIGLLMGVMMLGISNVSAGYRDTDRIEFGFALLPNEPQLGQLQEMRDQITAHIGDIPTVPSHPLYDVYTNKPVTLPHVTIGQYGLLASEVPELEKIVEEVAVRTAKLTEPMAHTLSFTDENIFFDCMNVHERTNPAIVETYKTLRASYMERINTKFMIGQAAAEEFKNMGNIHELQLFEQHFQNWGTPEDNRIRPHFTMVYNYTKPKTELEAAFARDDRLSALLTNLRQITFSRLSIVEIDFWGNPVPEGIIAEFPLQE